MNAMKLALISLTLLALQMSPVSFAVPALPKEFAVRQSTGQLTVLEFSAPWCGSCQKIRPAVDALEKRYKGQLRVVHINVDQDSNSKYLTQFDLASVPTFVLYNGKGQPITKIEREITATEFQKIVADHIGR